MHSTSRNPLDADHCDNKVFARKELNFERMSERDRKQIVAEVYGCPFNQG